MCVYGLVSFWSTYCIIYCRCTILTELQIDKLLFIATGLGPYTCLKAFAQFTTRAEFHTYIINECTMAQERLSGILHDMSNLDDIANSHDWATAAAPREPKCTGTYWIKCTSDSCFLHCKSTAAHVQLQWQPGMQVPCIKYNKMGNYELHEASHVHRCAHIMQSLCNADSPTMHTLRRYGNIMQPLCNAYATIMKRWCTHYAIIM